ncbi:COX9 [Candida theae]|uniref:COX9 n=1 Tax=Candida theae TaxID=1198502 RepID=A0AAD5BG04_9ASCO|nr:COX9 [Candida theae]KAI5960508.1 COX9 [Candida theae]
MVAYHPYFSLTKQNWDEKKKKKDTQKTSRHYITNNTTHTMAIAPITGTLKRKIITDITIGFAAGFTLATLYWYTEHTPLVAKREAYYAQLQKQKQAEDVA